MTQLARQQEFKRVANRRNSSSQSEIPYKPLPKPKKRVDIIIEDVNKSNILFFESTYYFDKIYKFYNINQFYIN